MSAVVSLFNSTSTARHAVNLLPTSVLATANAKNVTGDRVVMLDFNGDGKDDVLLAESNQLRVFSGTVLEAPGNWTPILLDTTDSGAITLASPRLLGDINGDGLEDFGYINNGAARVAAFVALPDNYATC